MASNVKKQPNEDMNVLLLSELLENPHCCSEMASNVKKQPSEDMDDCMRDVVGTELEESPPLIHKEDPGVTRKELSTPYLRLSSISEYEHGTAVAAVIGDNAAYVVTDGRSVSTKNGEEGLILKGYLQKLYPIGDRIVAAIAGNIVQCKGMIKRAVEAKEDGGDDVERIVGACEEFVEMWKANPLKSKWRSRVTIIGPTGEGMLIVVVGMRQTLRVKEKGALVATGSGEKWVKMVVGDRLKDNVFSSDQEYIDCLREAVACSSVFSASCGGLMACATVKLGQKVVYLETCHVIKELNTFRSQLQPYTKKCLLLVSHDLSYCLDFVSKMEKIVAKQLEINHVCLGSQHVLGVDSTGKIIVRVLVFEDEEATNIAFGCLKDFFAPMVRWCVWQPNPWYMAVLSHCFGRFNRSSRDFL